MGRVAGKVAVIAGGAQGVGAACARLLASEGAKVVLADAPERPALEVADEILRQGGSAMYVPQDPCDTEAWPRMFDLASRLFGRAGIFVNATTAGCRLSATEIGTRHALAAMRGGDDGSIVHLVTTDEPPVREALLALAQAATQCCRSGGDAIRINTVVTAGWWAPGEADVARAVLFLASEDSRALSGSELVVPPAA